MGVKVLQCFPWYKRCKDKGKARRRCPPQTVTSSEVGPQNPPTVACACEATAGAGVGPGYCSLKARVTYRHQMEGNVIDTTY